MIFVKRLSTWAVLAAVLASVVIAEVPRLLSYQGRLTDQFNVTVSGGLYEMTFAIYDSETGGTAKWSETQPDVSVIDGLFTVLLGSVVPLPDSIFSSASRYVEIIVAGGTVEPRTRLTSVGFSYRTGSIDGALGGTIDGPLLIIPMEFLQGGNAISIIDENNLPSIEISVGRSNDGSISFYQPVDSKDGFAAAVSKRLIVSDDGLVLFGNNETDTSLVMTQSDDGGGSVAFYEPVDSKTGFAIAPTKKFVISDNGLVMFGNTENDTSIVMTQSNDGGGTVSFYEPVDSKDGFAAVATKRFEVSDDGLIMFGASGSDTSVVLAQSDDGGSISFYDPVDSKDGFFQGGSKMIEMNSSGLIMFGQAESDTNLLVLPNGDIIGLGQITMGQNSSAGVQTSVLGFNNSADGDSSAIGGGSSNVTLGTSSVISGGYANTASGTGAFVGGGANNEAAGDYSVVTGGSENLAGGNYAVIPGGSLNVANGDNSFAAGTGAKAEHSGSFVWADQTGPDFVSSDDNQFIIRASGGVGIGTNDPVGLFEVAGAPGDSSVNLPGSAISAPEIWDEPGLSAGLNAQNVVLVQGAISAVDVVTSSITIPTDGYIMISAGATLATTGTNKANQAIIQIDETSGGGAIAPYYAQAGSGDHDSPSKLHYFSMNVQRVYFKPAGTYTFRLEAIPGIDNESGADTRLFNSHITAIYIPTAYGGVDQ